MNRTVVILGAGAGGLSAAVRMRELLGDDARVVVVDRSPTGVQGLSLLWVMRGWRTAEEVTVKPDFDRLGAEFVQADVHAIAPDEHKVVTSEGELSYDALVIALGARLSPEKLPGLAEAYSSSGAFEYYTLGGAARLHDRLTEVDRGRICVMISSSPFRCPAAPYEGALLISDLLAERGVRDRTQVEVFTPEPFPMPVAGKVVGDALSGMLADRNIALHTETPVSGVDGTEIVLTDGGRIAFDLLVAVPPHTPPKPVAEAGFGESGWIPVDAPTLRTGVEGVWALGDVSALTLNNGKPLPKAAVFARGQADAVAAGVARHLGYDAPDVRFDGHGYCFVEVGGGIAAKGEGDFLGASGPEVELFTPSADYHREKEDEEREWLTAFGSAVRS